MDTIYCVSLTVYFLNECVSNKIKLDEFKRVISNTV